MTKTTILHPDYYRVILCDSGRWFAVGSKLTSDRPVGFRGEYGITRSQLITELFRINGGKHGYYLANLKSKEYYYCGSSLENVRQQLLKLGIGRTDPNE